MSTRQTQADEANSATQPARVDLALIWRAAALATGDAGAGRVIAAEVARANPDAETVRDSTLIASYFRAIDRLRTATGSERSPEPLALDESAATIAAQIRSEMDGRALDVFLLRDVLGVQEHVLANALLSERPPAAMPDMNAALMMSGETIDALRSIYKIDTEPMLADARAIIGNRAGRKRKLALIQFAVFAVVVVFLVYVKVDLKRAADKEKASGVPSMVEQFSNPLPANESDPE